MKINNTFLFLLCVIFSLFFDFQLSFSQNNSGKSNSSCSYGIWEPYQRIKWKINKATNKWEIISTENVKPGPYVGSYLRVGKDKFYDKDGNAHDCFQYSSPSDKPQFPNWNKIGKIVLLEVGLKKPANYLPDDPYLKYIGTGRKYGSIYSDSTVHDYEERIGRNHFLDCENMIAYGGYKESVHLGGVFEQSFLIYKKISDDDGEIVVHNHVNNEIITTNSGLIINLYTQSNSTIYTSPGENSTCQLQADVDCSSPKDKIGRKVKIEFVGDAIGSFNTSESTTDANGKTNFTYIAPDESALKGKNEIIVQGFQVLLLLQLPVNAKYFRYNDNTR